MGKKDGGEAKEEKMDVDDDKKEKKKDAKKTDKDEKDTKDGKEKKEAEATFEILNNPARVMKPQLQVIKMEPPNSTEKAMYQPIKDISIGGVVMVKRVRDAEGDKKEEIVEPVKTSRKEDASTEEEPEPPEPFEYTE